MNRAIFVLLWSFALAAGWAQSAGISEHVRFSRDAGELQIQVNASKPFGVASLREGKETRDGVGFSAANGGVTLESGARPVNFELDELRGELPPEGALEIRWSDEQTVEFRTGARNPQPVRLSFPDGGAAEMPAEADCRAEFPGGGRYLLTGSTNVAATSADGLTMRFSRHAPAMAGGPQSEQRDERGVPRVTRSTPVGAVELSGSLEGEVKAGAAALVPGQEKLLSFPNGARILLKHDPDRALLEWKIMRGAGQFTIAGFSCWRASASSGQSGALQWNAAKRLVDLRHAAASSGWVTAQLSGRVTASVASGATFQYAQFQDCGSFATSAIGDAQLYDRETGESVPVANSGIAYNEGERVGSPGVAPGRPFAPVTLDWESDARVQLRAAGTTYPVGAGIEQTLSFGQDRLSADYRTDGSLLLRAVEGNFSIAPSFVPQLTFEVAEGGAVLLRLNRQRMMFTGQAGPDSASEVRVTSGGRTYMYLAGDARITVVLGQNSILPEGSPAWIFFEGAGGGQTFLSGQQPGRVILPNQISVDRIFQQPVTVLE